MRAGAVRAARMAQVAELQTAGRQVAVAARRGLVPIKGLAVPAERLRTPAHAGLIRRVAARPRLIARLLCAHLGGV